MAAVEPSSQATIQDSKGKGPQAEPAGTQPTEGQSPQNGNPGHASENVPRSLVNDLSVANGHASASEDTTLPAPGQVSPSNTQQAQPAPLEKVPATPSSSATKLRTDDSEKAKDPGTDRASFSEQSHRRKAAKSTSDLHTASTVAEKRPNSRTASKKSKPSFISKLFRVLVPCVTPSSRAHDVELDTTKVQPPVQQQKPPVEVKEQPVPNESEKPKLSPKPEPTTLPVSPIIVEETPKPLPSTEPEPLQDVIPIAPPPLQTIEVPQPSDDPSIVVPPTPTKALLSQEETEGVTSGAVQPPGSTGDDAHHEHHRRDSEDSDGSTSFTDDEDPDGPISGDQEDEEDEEEQMILRGGAGIPIGPDGQPRPLLPPLSPKHQGRKCLVLDLDETLVHSSFKSIQQADYVVPVEIEYHWHNVYVIKRPGVDNFLKKMGEIYEVVVFTASLSKYADPVLDKLDIHHVVSHRLFRESCYNHRGNYVKDLSQLGRPIADTIIIDNSPASYIFHPNNAVPVSSWFNDPHDTELTDLVPFLTDLARVDDVRGVLDGGL